MQLNVNAQAEITRSLARESKRLGAITLLTPGSDGRLEKGSMASKLEVIALVNAASAPDDLEKVIRDAFARVLPECSISLVEIKTNDTPLMQFNANGRLHPTRIQDAKELYGTGTKDHRLRLGQEIIAASADDVKEIADHKRGAKKVTEAGKNKIQGADAVHFDLDSGVVFYNPEANQLSFKVGPLRLVQNALMIEAVRHVRKSNKASFFESLESNIVDRLHQLSDDKMLSVHRKHVEEAAEHYAYFMRLYHRSEESYTRFKKVALQLTPAEIAEVKARLAALSGLMHSIEIKSPAEA